MVRDNEDANSVAGMSVDRPKAGTPNPSIASRAAVFTTPYFKLIGKRLDGQPGGDPYYSLEMIDYVSVVATLADGRFVLVRQFRPAVEAVMLELPAGHVETGQRADEAARTELLEETGYLAKRLTPVGCLKPDTGRLSNRMWVYWAEAGERKTPWEPEPGVEVVIATSAEMAKWLKDGTFDHALHVAAIFLTIQAGHIKL